MMTRWWLMNVDGFRWWRWIRADGPCWKGELQIGRVVFGWEREARS
jgi:hypothetical protein